jgi:hypothetical protein
MADIAKLTKLNINGTEYAIGESIYDKIGISFERFVELLDRDDYTPVLDAPPSSETLTYPDTDGTVCDFRIGQACVYPSAESADGFGIAFLKGVFDGEAVWQDLGSIEKTASNALAVSREAESYAKTAYANSSEAVSAAQAAKNAVATLEGLSDATTAMETLASQVSQIAQNTSDIEQLNGRHVVISEDEYDSLELKDQTKIYMLFEE